MSQRVAAFLLAVTVLPVLMAADEPSREDTERLKRLQEVEKNLSRRLAKPAEAKAARPPAPAELMGEITALQILYTLRLTPDQRQALRELARETAAKPRPPQEIKASDELRQTLLRLRGALVKEDEELVEKLGEKLDKLRKAENIEFDDEAEMTEAARRLAPAALKLLSARQVAAYLGSCADDIQDPAVLLVEALGKVRGLSDDDWKEFRDDVSDRVALLLAGLDEERVDELSEQVAAVLIEARNLKDDDFKARRPDLEKAARKVCGDLGPTDVLRNVLERTLAELLSNPRLPAALNAYSRP
jgi:hypothetical protein